jgi:cytochrome c oxidase cbb3-type subunit 3
MRSASCSAFVALMVTTTVLSVMSCEREKRSFREIPPAASADPVPLVDLRPGPPQPDQPVKVPYEQNAYAVAEGKRLYEAYNCVGCHAHGGGGMGPALMDDTWIYGSRPDQVFSTIVEGRPNGMPSFRHKVPNPQVWEIVAYVRSMSGQLNQDVAPNRDDNMNVKKPENREVPQKPKTSTSGAVR